MAGEWSDGWEDNSQVYSESQVEAVLEYAAVEIVGDTHTHFMCLCPFHGNSDSPAFVVDKHQGLWNCFNPSCMMAGTLEELLRIRMDLNPFQAMRKIAGFAGTNESNFAERLNKVMGEGAKFTQFPEEPVQRMYEQFKGSDGETYMKSRHFDDDTLDYFEIGYSDKKNMVVVPMHDPNGMLVGFVGRKASREDKTFKNTTGLPKSLTSWNFHRAKNTGDTVIICEASFDAMRIHQAGYPNVVALLGGGFNKFYAEQLGRTFTNIVIMTDMDKKTYYPNCRRCQYKTCKGHRPGRDLGHAIVERMPNKKVMWAVYDDDNIYPTWPLEGYRSQAAKDVSDMSDDEIRQCLRGAVSNLRYEQLQLEKRYDLFESNMLALAADV